MRKRPPEAMSIDRAGAGGVPLNFANEPPGPTTTAPLRLIEVLRPRIFDICPICGDPATTEEHVPPQRLGGMKMTQTCQQCNNGFGSLVEADLVDWFDGALTMPSFQSDAVRGKRQTSRLLMRWTPNGEFVLFPEGRSDPAVSEILAAGDFILEVSPPDEDRWRLALLKSVYLAICMKVGIPEGESADHLRAELLAVRNAKRKADVPVSTFARGLTVLRHWGDPITEESVVLAEIQQETGPLLGILFAGRIFVALSLTASEAVPAPTGRLAQEFHVGTSAEGTVTYASPEPVPRLGSIVK